MKDRILFVFLVIYISFFSFTSRAELTLGSAYIPYKDNGGSRSPGEQASVLLELLKTALSNPGVGQVAITYASSDVQHKDMLFRHLKHGSPSFPDLSGTISAEAQRQAQTFLKLFEMLNKEGDIAGKISVVPFPTVIRADPTKGLFAGIKAGIASGDPAPMSLVENTCLMVGYLLLKDVKVLAYLNEDSFKDQTQKPEKATLFDSYSSDYPAAIGGGGAVKYLASPQRQLVDDCLAYFGKDSWKADLTGKIASLEPNKEDPAQGAFLNVLKRLRKLDKLENNEMACIEPAMEKDLGEHSVSSVFAKLKNGIKIFLVPDNKRNYTKFLGKDLVTWEQLGQFQADYKKFLETQQNDTVASRLYEVYKSIVPVEDVFFIPIATKNTVIEPGMLVDREVDKPVETGDIDQAFQLIQVILNHAKSSEKKVWPIVPTWNNEPAFKGKREDNDVYNYIVKGINDFFGCNE